MTTPTRAYDVEFGSTYVKMLNTRGLGHVKQALPLATLPKATKRGHFWHVPFPDAATVVAIADEHAMSVDPRVRAYAETLWTRELDALAASSATALPPNTAPDPIHALTATLLPAQESAVHTILRSHVRNPATPDAPCHRAALIVDEPGLGKTIIALAALRGRGHESKKTVIVCPTSLTVNWQKEMMQHFELDAFTPFVATTQDPVTPPGEADTIIIGWDILDYWSSTLIAWQPDALVVDEGHYAKAGKRTRTKVKETVIGEDGTLQRDDAGNALTRDVAARHGLVLALTGTPIVNRPVELVALLRLTGILHLWGGERAFKMRYCGPQTTNTGRDRTAVKFDGASNLIELATRLRSSGHYVRRTKQVLMDAGMLQPKYVDHVFTFDYQTPPRPWLIRASREELADYRACVEDNARFFRSRAEEIAREYGVGVNTKKVRDKIEAEGTSAANLSRIVRQRQEAARVKVPHVISATWKLVEQGEKVVIAAHHREIVDAYADAFTGLKIQGGMGVKAIEEAKRLFNETPASEHPVLVLSVEAGKTGHTLCKQHLSGVGPACAYMIFAEQIWTPGDESQAQDRIWRIGQDRTVRISNAVLAGTIDEDIYWTRAKKRRVVNAAIDAVESSPVVGADERTGNRRIVRALTYGQDHLDP